MQGSAQGHLAGTFPPSTSIFLLFQPPCPYSQSHTQADHMVTSHYKHFLFPDEHRQLTSPTHIICTTPLSCHVSSQSNCSFSQWASLHPTLVSSLGLKRLRLGLETMDLFHTYLGNLDLLCKQVQVSSSAQHITPTNHNLSGVQNVNDFDQRPKAIKSLDYSQETWFGSVLMLFHCGLFSIYFFKYPFNGVIHGYLV